MEPKHRCEKLYKNSSNENYLKILGRGHTYLGSTNPSGTEKQCRRQYFSHNSIRLSRTACVNWRIEETPYSAGDIISYKETLDDCRRKILQPKSIKNEDEV